MVPSWWLRPRRVTILNDTIGWATPWCERLRDDIAATGDACRLVHRSADLEEGEVAFFLGCTRMVKPAQLALHRHNLVVHASALPKGRGFSPLKWLICEGADCIPLTLFEASEGCDEGLVYGRAELPFAGHELLDEMQDALGALCNRMCLDFLAAPQPPTGEQQQGEPSYYGRRGPEHQRLDPSRSIAEQFEILRTVDNERFPAFFDLRGHRYEVIIRKSAEVPADD